MTPRPFAHTGRSPTCRLAPTEQGADARAADARALRLDLAAARGADLLLVGVVAAVWTKHLGEQTGPAVPAYR